MTKPLFTGVCTALVTPFLDGKINFPLLEILLRRQYDAGIRAVVLAGTTGEAPTLSDREKLSLIDAAKTAVPEDMCLIAGTGSNDTEHALRLSREAEARGADGLLVVTPYYNKTNDDGLFAYYSAIAHSVSIPVIPYNVPSRTGVDIPVSVYRRLAEIPNIAGAKEASTSPEKFLAITVACPNFPLWTGNDNMTAGTMALGGQGVISVISNAVPHAVKAMTDAALRGDFQTAAAQQRALFPLTELCFSDVSPIPVKEVLRQLGFDCGTCRLPLPAPSDALVEKIRRYLE